MSNTPKELSFDELWKDIQPTDFDDSVEARYDFMESVITDEVGKLIRLHEIHRKCIEIAYNWQADGYKEGMIRMPFGHGKSANMIVGIPTYEHTLEPNHMDLIVSSVPDTARKRIRGRRMIIESDRYKQWCKKNDIKPLTYDRKWDNGGTETLFLDSANQTGNPSAQAVGVGGGGIGHRASRLYYDDAVDKESLKSAVVRQEVFDDMTNKWDSRKIPSAFTLNVFTPWHPEDANMRRFEQGGLCQLMIRVNKEKTGYELYEWRPSPNPEEPPVLVQEILDIPLWTEYGFDRQFYIDKEKADPIMYQRGYEMAEEVVNELGLAYPLFSSDHAPEGNVTDKYDYEPGGYPPYLFCDFNVEPHCWGLAQEHGEKMVIFDEIISDRATTPEQAERAVGRLNKYGIKRIKIIGDAKSSRGRYGYNDYEMMKEVFKKHEIRYSDRTAKSNPSVEQSKLFLNVMFKDTYDVRRVLIHERCKKAINEFKKLPSNPDGSINKKFDAKMSHFSDAVRYLIWYHYKIRKSGISRPQSWYG